MLETIKSQRAPLTSILPYYIFVAAFVIKRLFCLKFKQGSSMARRMKVYANGERRVTKELDVVNLLRSVRLSKVLQNSLLTQR